MPLKTFTLAEFLATGTAEFVLQSSPAAPITLRPPSPDLYPNRVWTFLLSPLFSRPSGSARVFAPQSTFDFVIFSLIDGSGMICRTIGRTVMFSQVGLPPSTAIRTLILSPCSPAIRAPGCDLPHRLRSVLPVSI
jgi:hypothetical protein